MIWNVSFILMCICIMLTIIAAVWFGKKRSRGLTKPFNIVLLGTIITVFIGIFPVNIGMELSPGEPIGTIEAIALSVANVLQVFSADMDGKELLATIGGHSFYFDNAYAVLMSILSSIAPIMTVGAIFSLLTSVSATKKYVCGFFKPTYVFSELNERSLTLAKDLKNNHPESMVIFTDVLKKEEELYFELTSEAKSVGAVLFKEDITRIRFNFHSKSSKIYFFIIGENETENIAQASKLIDKYKKRKSTRMDIFSASFESELALSGIDKGEIKVRRINEVQSLIYHTLYESGTEIFDKSNEQEELNKHEDGVKHINAIVIGMNDYGLEMIKALSWYCQMDGYKLSLDAFDLKSTAESEFKAQCPDLMSPKYNDISVDGESYYKISIHSGVDVNSSEILDIFKEMDKATYIFVSVGSDEENVKAAANMRMAWRRLGANPIIQAVVKNAKAVKMLENVANFKGQKYDLELIGNIEQAYSESDIIDSKLEEISLKRHLKWGPEESFWEFEYNYRSSVASVIHKKARAHCHVKGNDKLDNGGIDALNDSEKESLCCLEHRRWNAYMRGEGYIYAENRDDLAKTHHLLVNFYSLQEKEREKDIW